MSVAYPNFEEWADQSQTFAQMAAFRAESFSLAAGGKAEHVRAREASASFLNTVGVATFPWAQLSCPRRSRGGCAGCRFWDMGCGRRSSRRPEIVGKPVVISDKSYTVVGVLPDHFWFTAAELLIPMGARRDCGATIASCDPGPTW